MHITVQSWSACSYTDCDPHTVRQYVDVDDGKWKEKVVNTRDCSRVNNLTSVISYHCEEVLILHNKPHPPPQILSDDTKVGRCKGYFGWQQLKVVTKPHPVCQLCGGGHTRDLYERRERERERQVVGGRSMYAYTQIELCKWLLADQVYYGSCSPLLGLHVGDNPRDL